MPAKHLVLVHGQSTHPRRPEKDRYVRTALLHGLARVSPIAAGLVDSDEVRTSQVYFGDVCNEVLCDADVASVSHGRGTVAAYDVLWKFSHMSEYEVIHDRRVTLWLTLGSPLTEPAVRASRYDAAEHDFGEMRAHGCRIVDLAPMYTFWVGASGSSDPHAMYGYLDHPIVAEQIAGWALAST